MTDTQNSNRPSSFSLAEKSVPFDVLRLLDVLATMFDMCQDRVRALRHQQVPSWADGQQANGWNSQ